MVENPLGELTCMPYAHRVTRDATSELDATRQWNLSAILQFFLNESTNKIKAHYNYKERYAERGVLRRTKESQRSLVLQITTMSVLDKAIELTSLEIAINHLMII